MASCPACGRAVALDRASCLYCGGPLEPPPERPAAPAAAAPSRRLVLVDLGRSEPSALAEVLSLSRYDAGLLTRRGGLHLVKAASEVEAAAEAERLRAVGVGSWVVPESEVRERPLQCLAGEPRKDGLWLRSALGPVTLASDSVFLVVSGPITREHQASDERRKILRARLDEGFRLHLHRREAAPPFEIDANNFEVGFAVSGSVRLELESWLDAALKGARRDTGFSRLPPVLAPAEPEAKGGALAAAGSLAAASRADAERGVLVLDNLAQFRFYSGCLAAVERRQ